MRIGIFGGSFNPVHYMHLSICNTLLNKHCVDKIIIVPAGVGYKYKCNLIDNDDRYNMLKMICNDKIDVSYYELDTRKHYTYDTLNYFKKIYPNDEIYFVCGTDNLSYIDEWSHGIKLLSEYKFLIINRNGNNINNLLLKYKEYKNNIEVVDIEMNDISSTMIRNKILNNEDVSMYLNKDVYKYIIDNGLYKK